MIGIVIGVVVIVVIAGVFLHNKMQSDSPQKEQTKAVQGVQPQKGNEAAKQRAVYSSADSVESAEPENGREDVTPAGNTAEGRTGREEVSGGLQGEGRPEAADGKRKEQEERQHISGEESSASGQEQERSKKAQEAAAEREMKGELYRFFNHGLQLLYTAYNEDEWDKTEVLGTVSPELYGKMDTVIRKLPTSSKELLTGYLSCIEFGREDSEDADGGNGQICASVKDKDKLKEAFLKCMMPFYPYYYQTFKEGGIRYTALLAPNTLRLYHQLTGKNFRPGYRNRYKSGVRAFEWEKNRYRIFAENGALLCDAVFEDGKIISGSGQSTERDPENPEWDIVREGEWKDGVFTEKTVRYQYRKPVNI